MDIEKYLIDNNYVSSSDPVSILFFTTLCSAVYNQALEDAAEKAKQVIQEDEDDSTIIIEILNLKKP